MTPAGANISSLSNDFTGLTTKSEEKDDGVPYEGKQVTIPAENNPGFYITGFLTNSGILQPPYTADHCDQYKMVSPLESRVITAINQDASETEIKEIFFEAFKDSADAQDVFQRMLRSAFTKGMLSLVRGVATLTQAKDYLVELSSGKHPSPNGLVKFLLQGGVDPNAGATGKQTPLYQAAESGNMELVEHLLQANADPNARASGEETPLYLAAITLSKKEKEFKYVEKGTSREAFDQYCNKMKNCVELAKKLIAAGADPDPLDAQGRTPLTLLTKHATDQEGYKYSFELFEHLLNTAKANPDGKASGKNTPLYTAAQSSDPRCLQMLLDKGADVNGRATGRDTPLYAAAAVGWPPGRGRKIVPLLLEKNADADAFSTGKNTPLFGAIAGQGEGFVEGFFSGTNCTFNKSPYVERRVAVVKALLEKADVNANAVGRETPLYAAATAYESDPGMVSLLLSYHADANANAKGLETPLGRVLDVLLESKADKMSINMAIEQVIKPLADAGADPDARTEQEEEKPRSIAQKIGDKKLSKCLKDMSKEFHKRHQSAIS